MSIVIGIKKLFKIPATKIIRINSDKVFPKTSIVLLVKNNKKLLESTLNLIKSNNQMIAHIAEIVVFDFGSIDDSLNIAQDLLKDMNNSRVVDAAYMQISSNRYDMLRSYVNSDVILLINLNKIDFENPNIFLPDLFLTLNSVNKKNKVNKDSLIDGTKLLFFDEIEREKNSFALREYSSETLSNIRMSVETYVNKYCKSSQEQEEEQQYEKEQLLKFIDRFAWKMNVMIRLIGTVNYLKSNLNENLYTLFKDYSASHNVSIVSKLAALPNDLSEDINKFVLRVMQDLLYTILEYNHITDLSINIKNRGSCIFVLVKHEISDRGDYYRSDEKTLNYYVLQSIQNRLSLIGGNLRMYIKPHRQVKILVKIPYFKSEK